MAINIEQIKKLRELTGLGMMEVKKSLELNGGNIEKSIKWLRENGTLKAQKKQGRIAAEGRIFVKSTNMSSLIIEMNSETDFVASNKDFISLGNKILDTIFEKKVEDISKILNFEIDSEKIGFQIDNLISKIGEKITLRRVKFIEGKTSHYIHSNSKIGVIVAAKDMNETLLKDVSIHIAAMAPKYLNLADVPREEVLEEKEIALKGLGKSLENKPENIRDKILEGKINKSLSAYVLMEQIFVKDSSKKISDLKGSHTITEFVRYEVGEGIDKKVEDFAEEVKKQQII